MDVFVGLHNSSAIVWAPAAQVRRKGPSPSDRAKDCTRLCGKQTYLRFPSSVPPLLSHPPLPFRVGVNTIAPVGRAASDRAWIRPLVQPFWGNLITRGSGSSVDGGEKTSAQVKSPPFAHQTPNPPFRPRPISRDSSSPATRGNKANPPAGTPPFRLGPPSPKNVAYTRGRLRVCNLHANGPIVAAF